jgi:carbonic anhydrase
MKDSRMPFCTVISCMDGRIQRPVMDFLASKYGYDFPDTITDPGPVKDLANVDNSAYLDRICVRIDISVQKHGSRHIFVTGHHDCAGNPVSREIQLGQLKAASLRIKARFPDCQVDTVYINDQWCCEDLGD